MSPPSPAAAAVPTAARAYLARGWAVIPVRPGDKAPLVAWQVYQESPPEPEQLDAWFARWPDAGVGVVTGAVSGLVVLDIDPAHGARHSLPRLEREHGPLPRTVEAVSGGGGRHLYFRHPGGRVRNRVGLAAGVDLRGDGGFVVAPPSAHASGARYAWVAGRNPEQVDLAPLPGWLLEAAGGGEHRGHSLQHWRSLVRGGVEEGERNNSIASLSGHLLWHGVDPGVVLELLLCWNRVRCRPPLSDAEVARTVESIARLHADDH